MIPWILGPINIEKGNETNLSKIAWDHIVIYEADKHN